MYWTDWGTNPRIERADMDGQNRHTIVRENLAWPNGLTIDRPTGRIIWVDARTEVIECADLRGESRRILVTSVPHPYGLTVAGNYLYWTDWKEKAIKRANKDTGDEIYEVRGKLPRLMSIHAVQLDNVGGYSYYTTLLTILLLYYRYLWSHFSILFLHVSRAMPWTAFTDVMLQV